MSGPLQDLTEAPGWAETGACTQLPRRAWLAGVTHWEVEIPDCSPNHTGQCTGVRGLHSCSNSATTDRTGSSAHLPHWNTHMSGPQECPSRN